MFTTSLLATLPCLRRRDKRIRFDKSSTNVRRAARAARLEKTRHGEFSAGASTASTTLRLLFGYSLMVIQLLAIP